MPSAPLSLWERFWQIAVPLAFAVCYIAALWQVPHHPTDFYAASYSYGSLPPVPPERVKMALLDTVKMVGGIGWFVTLLFSLRRFAGFSRPR